MPHTDPFTSDPLLTTPPRHRARPSADPDESSSAVPKVEPEDQPLDINALLEKELLADPELRLLVVTLDAVTPTIDPERERVIYVASSIATGRPESQAAAHMLPMSSNAFDVVVGYRLVRPGCDAIPLLREALRVLRKGGSMLLVTDPRDFALLPPQGPAHLAQRSLTGAGIHGARFTQYGATSLAVIRNGNPRG